MLSTSLPRSSALFHYTKSIENLQNILKYGFFPFYHLESLPFGNNPEIAFPMVSFCDIPISRISEHLEFYGSYGLAMDKSNWGEAAHKINPILYISANSRLPKFIELTFKGAKKLKDAHSEDQYLESIRNLCAYIKCIRGKALTVKKEFKDKEFYFENEWRYVPIGGTLKPYLTKKEYENKETLSSYNRIATEERSLKIHPNNIRYIVVKDDWDVFELITFIEKELKDTDDRKKQLISKILPLEFILEDL